MPISPQAHPSLVKKARLKYDSVRSADMLLLPERVVKLNQSAAAILKLIDGSRTVDEITRILEEQHQQVDLAADVLEFLEDAKEKGWIQVNSIETTR